MKTFFKNITLFLLLITFCSAKHCVLANRFMNSFIKQVKKEYGLEVFGSGGAMMNDIESITLHFSSDQKMKVNEARVMYVNVLEKFLKEINADEKIRPYLHNYPFTTKNVELSITFFDKNHKRFDDNFLAFVSMIHAKDIIYYDISDPKVVSGNPLTTVHEERYEDALRIVKKMNNPASNEVENHSGILQNNNFPISNSDVRVDDGQEVPSRGLTQ